MNDPWIYVWIGMTVFFIMVWILFKITEVPKGDDEDGDR